MIASFRHNAITLDGLMSLLLDIGKAYQALTSYDCKKAITLFESLPIHQLSTCWVMEKLAMSLYETGENSLVSNSYTAPTGNTENIFGRW